MPERPAGTQNNTSAGSRLGAATSATDPTRTPPPPVPEAPATPAPPRAARVRPPAGAADPLLAGLPTPMDVDSPPEVRIWGPPQSKTTLSLRVPVTFQRWFKAWSGRKQVDYGLPEGVIPLVTAQFIAENREEILRRAVEAVHRDT